MKLAITADIEEKLTEDEYLSLMDYLMQLGAGNISIEEKDDDE